MTPFNTVVGTAAPLLRANLDTDVIIRIERLTAGKDIGHYAFEALRFLADGSPNPDCVLNEPRFRGAPILLCGRNFGCGSSREGAVTALMQWGVRCVIAPSFGDIFHANCFRNGLLPIVLAESTIERLAAQCRDGDFTINLAAETIVTPAGEVLPFRVDPLQREGLLQGLDEIGLTLQWLDEIDAWQSRDRTARPWIWTREEERS